MPFSVREDDRQLYNDANHWTEVYAGLVLPAVKKAGGICDRDDMDNSSRLIVENILGKIEESDIVLCDLSSHNPNVFLELGWTLRADKPYVLIKDDLTQFTFDLNQQFTYEYDHRLKPTVLQSQINELADTIKNTLNDTNKRFSVVQRMSVHLSAIEAARTGDHQMHILLNIQEKLKSIAGSPMFQSSSLEFFPWAELLARAVHIMFKARDEIPTFDSLQYGYVDSFRQKMRDLGVDNRPDLQVTVIRDDRSFAYHDWDDMIGKTARLYGFNAEDIYEEVFKHPHGVVAWADRTTNIPRTLPPQYIRLNIAVFCTPHDGNGRIVVEAHHEITGT